MLFVVLVVLVVLVVVFAVEYGYLAIFCVCWMCVFADFVGFFHPCALNASGGGLSAEVMGFFLVHSGRQCHG